MTLFTVLIVDDEAFIVDWLASILEENPNFSINVYRAYSPAKAIEIMERTRTDLLITDIQMPNMSGFELTEKMHSLWPNSKTILLTAYPDFNYAQQAIKLGVLGYVLKTAHDTEILSEVENALTIIEKERNQASLVNHLERDLKNFQSQLNRQLFFQWLNGYYHYHSASTDFKSALDALGFLPSPENTFALILGTPAVSGHESTQINSLIRPFQIQRITNHYLSPYAVHLAFEISNQSLVGIMQLDPAITQYTTIISGALELAQAACLETLGCHVSYLISPLGTPGELPAYWFYAHNLQPQFNEQDCYIYAFGKHEKTEENVVTDISSDSSAFLKSSFFNNMKKNLENGDREEFLQALKSVCSYLSANYNWHNNISLQIYYSLILVFITYINQKNLSAEIAFHVSTGTLFRPWLLESWEAVENQLFQLTDALLQMHIETQKRTADNIIHQIQSYVKEHVTEDISLLDLSDATGYSSTYLSKYYSDTTGSTISHYIAEKKMKNIDELMQNSELNIGDIASFVGFHSRTYFNNYIKRLTGMSPQKYRESLLEKQI